MSENIKILIGTFKGAWTIIGNSARDQWHVEGPLHLGSKVYHYVADPRNPDSLLLTEVGGHLDFPLRDEARVQIVGALSGG